MRKRILSLILALVMASSCIVIPVAAEDEAKSTLPVEAAVEENAAEEAEPAEKTAPIGEAELEKENLITKEILEEEMLEQPALLASSGTCGENLTWRLDDEGTLWIEGSGAMRMYSYDVE